jgi:MoxR-like ATPase
MSKSASKATQFLAAMRQSEPSESGTPPPANVAYELSRPRTAKAPTRVGLKHFGGYLDDDTLEKIALLRIRLKKDNSELIKQAIDDLYRKHNAKRAFGDA